MCLQAEGDKYYVNHFSENVGLSNICIIYLFLNDELLKFSPKSSHCFTGFLFFPPAQLINCNVDFMESISESNNKKE